MVNVLRSKGFLAMAWDFVGADLAAVTLGSAVLLSDGRIIAKFKSFSATASDALSWVGLFADLRQCRRCGLMHAGKMMFVTEFDSSLIVARRDHLVVILLRSAEHILAAVCDQTAARAAYAQCMALLPRLADNE
jgi:hypothetical protein